MRNDTAPDAEPHRPARVSLELDTGEVHVWRASLAQPPAILDRLAATLSSGEREQAQAFRESRLREAFVAGRGIGRAILAAYSATRAEHLQYAYSASGKPSLDPNPRDLRFSVANAGGLAVYAVAIGREVGIDIEPLRTVPDAVALARRFFAPAEVRVIDALPDEERSAWFLSCWTRKEAYLKALGCGLGRPLDAFTVSVDPAAEARLVEDLADPEATGRWRFLEIGVLEGFAAALVAEGTVGRVRRHEWSEDAVSSR
jgi:4'-phosphopantetheinyl transferase